MSLSLRQQELLEYMLANPMLPETVCAKNCGVPKSTYFDWKSKGDFPAELQRRIREKWKDSERLAVEQMQSLAREGDFKASKYILDSLGYAPAQKLEANVKGALEINIDIDED